MGEHGSFPPQQPCLRHTCRFANRRNWVGILLAVQNSYSDAQLDDVVQLRSMERQTTWSLLPPPEGAHRVYFRSLEQARVALAQGPMRADAEEFVPRAMTLQKAKALAEQAIDVPEVDLAELVDSRDLADSLASTAVPLAVRKVTEEQKGVARRLLVGFRKRVSIRKLEKVKKRTQVSCDSFFLSCLLRSKGMNWSGSSLYRKLYLGIVPHLLTCADVLQSYALSAKRQARSRWRDESEKDLEGLGKQITELKCVSFTSCPVPLSDATELALCSSRAKICAYDSNRLRLYTRSVTYRSLSRLSKSSRSCSEVFRLTMMVLMYGSTLT